jgi:hypothetical protein
MTHQQCIHPRRFGRVRATGHTPHKGLQPVRGKNTSEKAVQKKEARGRKSTVEELEHFSVSILPSVLWKATLMMRR